MRTAAYNLCGLSRPNTAWFYLAKDYSLTMIGRSKRDYVWIMARAPSMPAADYAGLMDLLRSYGYDIRRVTKVPQQIEGRPPGA